MPQSVNVKLVTAGADTGPYFDIYTDADCYYTPLVENVPLESISVNYNPSGYDLVGITDQATRIRVKSKGNCQNYVDIPITLS